MLTPEGLPGDKTDKIMLLAMWTQTLKNEAIDVVTRPFISAGMGKPTFPINIHTVEMYLQYWQGIEALVTKPKLSSELDMTSAALGYGDALGDAEPRELMAEAMTKWYSTDVKPANILFTVGGAGALRIIFETFNGLYHDTPKYRVITPFPHYTLYSDNQHQLHPVNVMKEPGYQLTANALESSIQSANKLAEYDNNYPKVVLLCNPSNPLGTVISEAELINIASVLRKYSELHIVIDEAYAEMYWYGKRVPSLLEIAPDLKERVVILRSATKALSAAGERMAMLIAFNSSLMAKLCDKNIGMIGHAPRSAQLAYAHTMAMFSDEEQTALKDFYKPKVDFVCCRLKEIGACMPEPLYTIEGTFYVLGDFSDLLGWDIPDQAKRALGKTGKVETSEDLAYSLLFKESLMLAPGAYFGMSPRNGYLRITCSDSENELIVMMDRLEKCLLQVRQKKAEQLVSNIVAKLPELSVIDKVLHQSLTEEFALITSNNGDCLSLKIQNQALQNLWCKINVRIKKETSEGRLSAARTIHSFLSNVIMQRKETRKKEELKAMWKNFVNEMASDGSFKNYLLNLNEADKASFKPWLEHLKSLEEQKRAVLQ